ncbi:MAG TPA: CYTH and CHAD domain-containing protein [Acidimicrobiales bacterium]|nr:CYTH and CHAD domain-containing protein [Acidimicrobiales bacterium]
MDVVEEEHKYEAERSTELPDIERVLPSGARIAHRAPIELDATYFDTTDRRLLRCGLTLRRRSGGGDAGWHLKVPGEGAATREEIRRPLSAALLPEVPAELADLVLARLRGEPLRPVARIRTRRVVHEVLDSAGPVVEIADDTVRAEVVGEAGARSWREIEVEVQPRGHKLAKRVAASLRAVGIRPSTERSKLATLLLPDDSRDARVHHRREVLRARLVEQSEELVARDLDVRRGRPDAVHDLRVAARRLRSCLQSFAPLFDEGSSARLGVELRWLSGLLRAARDLEVLARRIDGEIGEALALRGRAEVRRAVKAQIEREQRAAVADLDEGLRSPRYAALLDDVLAFADRPAYRAGRRPRRQQLLARVDHDARRVRRRLRRGRRAEGPARDVLLHEARKAAKRARYAAETIAPLRPRRAAALARHFEEVQERLGERQDAVVSRAFLEELAHDGDDASRAVTFALGALARDEERRVAEVDGHLPKARAAALGG